MTEDELVAARQKIQAAAGRGAAPMGREVEKAQTTPPAVERILEVAKVDTETPFDAIAATMIALRILGKSYKEIADQVRRPLNDVRRVLAEARRLSKLADVGPMLDNIALPQAVDNLIDKLEAGDTQATLATLRGRGAFRNFERSDNVDMQVQLSVQIEAPPVSVDGAVPHVAQGSVVGIPRRVGQSVLADTKNDGDDEER